MTEKLPPEFDISKVRVGELAGVLTVKDALEYLKPAYAPDDIRVIWTAEGEAEGYGIAGNDVPDGLLLSDMRRHVENKEIVIRLITGNGGAPAKIPELT